MNPEQMITTLESQLLGKLNVYRSNLADEISEIIELWDGLGRAGGQRADHAAELMSRLRPILSAIESFASIAQTQITTMLADPFERKDGA